MEDTTETTEKVEVVGQSGITTPTVPVSSGPSSEEIRIRSLMSENDKLRNDRTKTLADRAAAQKLNTDLQAQLQTEQQNSRQEVDRANKATQDALDAAQAHESRVATLEEQLAKTKVLADHPELRPFATTILGTSLANLEAVVANLKEATSMTKETITSQLRSGVIPASNPARDAAETVMDAQQLKTWLNSSVDLKEKADRLEIAKKMVLSKR